MAASELLLAATTNLVIVYVLHDIRPGRELGSSGVSSESVQFCTMLNSKAYELERCKPEAIYVEKFQG